MEKIIEKISETNNNININNNILFDSGLINDTTVEYTWYNNPNKELRFMGSAQSLIIATICYYLVITLLSKFIRSRGGKRINFQNLTTLVSIHNIVLCIYSIYCFVGTTIVLYSNWKSLNFNPIHLVCNQKLLADLDQILYFFYLSKYYEWIDTIILILVRGKPQIPPINSQQVLHIFHHGFTAGLVFVNWKYLMTCTWSGPFTNSFVHILMYFYYSISDFCPKIRKFAVFITIVQLIQFVFCMSIAVIEIIFLVIYPSDCYSDRIPICFNLFCYCVLLYLFLRLFTEKKQIFTKSNN